MIVTKDNERLYLTSWSYNAARIVSRLAELVKEQDGHVKPTHPAMITNRTLSGNIRERRDHLARCLAAQKAAPTDLRAQHIQAIRDELERLEAIPNDPIQVTHTTYISFTLGGMYYYYQLDDNPFFDFFGHKSPIQDGRYNPQAYCSTDRKRWWNDDLLRYACSADLVDSCAHALLRWLTGLPANKMKRDACLRRVDF